MVVYTFDKYPIALPSCPQEYYQRGTVAEERRRILEGKCSHLSQAVDRFELAAAENEAELLKQGQEVKFLRDERKRILAVSDKRVCGHAVLSL